MADTRPVYALTKLNDKTYWNQVGVAFAPNQDGSITLQLNCVPLSGKLQIRDKQSDADESVNGHETGAHRGR